MLKILQARLQQYVNHEIPDIQAVFRKGSKTRNQIANIHCIIEKERKFHKNILILDYTKAFGCIDHKKTGKFLNGEYQITLPASCETCIHLKKQQLEPDI